MSQVWWLWALFALVVGGVLGYLVASRKARVLETELDEAQEQRLTALQEAAADRSAREQLEQRVDSLEARSVQDQNVMRALAPLNDQLSTVGRHVNQMERDRAQQFGAVAQALEAARTTDQQLLQATGSLESSLRSTTARGAWGEMQLRRVVEAAGMTRHVDFAEQSVRTTDSGVQRPDMVVNLPGAQTVVVDAKAPMNSYLDAQAVPSDGAAESEQRRAQLLVAHAKALRSHVNTLGTKRYWSAEENSPELVMCFVPIESALAAALDADASLLEYAARNNVALVSPVSLLAALKAVAFSWRQATLTDNARELYRLSRELYDRMGAVGKHLADMGGSLRRSVDGYNKLVGSLESRVLPSARKIAELDPTSTGTDALDTKPVDSVPRPVTATEFVND
ncbi:DNA recombination protein RmuC [Kocuria marina subsp. indica]|uniref:DNA recombination protein RmuC n=2 Tax=Kocuria marina TaxID=223184 RepID=A0A1X7CNB0_9MICC|nr:recombinase RmuC [Kocuria indica]RLP58685.1 DNA recombination protein RmuC [Kocuria indica]SME99524.1 DNA recombination protein RmuC [Kocuria indica]